MDWGPSPDAESPSRHAMHYASGPSVSGRPLSSGPARYLDIHIINSTLLQVIVTALDGVRRSISAGSGGEAEAKAERAADATSSS